MPGALDFYINMLANMSGVTSTVAGLKALDSTVQQNNAHIQELEKGYAAARKQADSLAATGDKKGSKKAGAEAVALQRQIASAVAANATTEAKASAIATKSKAAQIIADQKALDLSRKQEVSAAKHAVNMQKVAAQQAKLSGATKEQSGVVEQAENNWKAMKDVLGKGGAVGVAIALAVALAAVAAGVVVATIALAKYALTASDAARSSRLLSDAATGSAAGGKELETVVDQLSNKIPQARQKTAEWARELALANIQGRDMQRTLTTMGTVAAAVGDSAAGKIKGIAEASRMAQKLMLGARDRFGEFASLAGTGIKAADIYAAVSKSMKTSIPEAKRMVDAGIVPFRKGLEALEAAAETKFGPIVARQMMSLDVQAAKLKENISRLFSGANIDKFLAGLKTVTDLFDTNTVMGYVLREVFTSIFTKVAEVASKVFPYVRAAILGVAFGVIMLATQAKQLYRQFQQTFGGVGSDVNGIMLAFKIGIGVVGLFVGSVVALTAALGFLGLMAAVATAPIWIPFALLALTIYLAVKAANSLSSTFTSLGKTLSQIDLGKAAENIMNSLINGIKNKIADVKSAFTDVGAAITGAFDAKMEIRSPSKVMQRRANFVVDPLVSVPNERATEVQAAIGGMGNLGKPAMGRGNAAAAPQNVTHNWYITGANAEEIARKVDEVLTFRLMAEAGGHAR